jgi:hypothetical protein
MKTSIIILFVIFLVACSANKNTTAKSPFSNSEMERAAFIFPGTTSDQLVMGKTLFEGNCGTCHALKKIDDYTEEQWREINPKMVAKANKYKDANLSAEAEQSILKYVVTLAKH